MPMDLHERMRYEAEKELTAVKKELADANATIAYLEKKLQEREKTV